MQSSSQIITTNKPPTPSFFTGRMPLLSPNQQCQSTEGKLLLLLLPLIIIVIITFDNELCDCAIVFLCLTRYLEKLWLELDEIFRVYIQYTHWANLQAY